jgi:hypothetical protein
MKKHEEKLLIKQSIKDYWWHIKEIKQGYPEKAIKVYEQLELKIPEKMSYFAALIEKIKEEHNLWPGY